MSRSVRRREPARNARRDSEGAVDAQGLQAQSDLLLDVAQFAASFGSLRLGLAGPKRGRQRRSLVEQLYLGGNEAGVLEDLERHSQRLGRGVPARVFGKWLAEPRSASELTGLERLAQVSR